MENIPDNKEIVVESRSECPTIDLIEDYPTINNHRAI